MTRQEWIVTIVAALIWLFVIVSYSHCEEPCHPGQHTCMTDASCEEEEAYFLDLDELHQSDNESLNDNTVKQLSPSFDTNERRVSPTRILEVK